MRVLASTEGRLALIAVVVFALLASAAFSASGVGVTSPCP